MALLAVGVQRLQRADAAKRRVAVARTVPEQANLVEGIRSKWQRALTGDGPNLGNDVNSKRLHRVGFALQLSVSRQGLSASGRQLEKSDNSVIKLEFR